MLRQGGVQADEIDHEFLEHQALMGDGGKLTQRGNSINNGEDGHPFCLSSRGGGRYPTAFEEAFEQTIAEFQLMC